MKTLMDEMDYKQLRKEDVRWRMLMWALPLAAVSSLGGLLNLENLPAAVPVDYWIHGIISVTFALLAIWVAGQGRWGRRFDILLVTLTTVAVTSRLLYALIVQGTQYPPHELLLPVSSYVPLVFVISFAMLPRVPAVVLSMSFYGVTTGAVAWYVFQHIIEINQSGEGIALLQQFVFGHAIYIAVLYVIPTIARERQRLAVERDALQQMNLEHLQREERDATRKAAMEAAGMGAWSVDFVSRVITFDEQSHHLLGIEPKEGGTIPMDDFLQIIEPEDRERVRNDLQAAINNRGSFDVSYNFRVANDRRRRVVRQRAATITDAAGQPSKLAGIVWDITESQRLSEELEQRSRQLERSNAELERFAYAASHDLQAPLRGIAGFAQLLEMQYKDKLDDTGREYIATIVSSVKSMRNLITGMLELSRAGNIDEEPQPINLLEPLNIALERLQSVINERDVRISVEDMPEVMGHVEPLAQLLQNLIGNAIKFQPDKPPEISIQAQRSEDGWEIQVSDNGMGIPEAELAEVFNVFQRASGSEHIEGSGIGLAVCKRIVNRHGGEIRVESKPGVGTKMYFTLPGTDRRTSNS